MTVPRLSSFFSSSSARAGAAMRSTRGKRESKVQVAPVGLTEDQQQVKFTPLKNKNMVILATNHLIAWLR